MVRASIILSVFTAVFLSSSAKAASDYIVMTPDKIPGWEAVGRVTFARTGAPQTCTGTLVTPNKVVTAAHCVSLQFGKAETAAQHLIFQAGKSGVSVVEVMRVARISYHPDYAPGSGLQNIIPSDLAVLHLEASMEHVTPMLIAAPPEGNETVSYLGHRANGRNPPRLTEDCSQQMLSTRVLELGCQAISGNSGAGVIWQHDGMKRLVAVISAAGDGRSYAVIPDRWFFSVLGES